LVPYNLSTNILILYTTASSSAYPAFVTTFKALKAPFFQQEKVLQFPGRGRTINKLNLVPEEFVAEDNVNYQKDLSASKGVNTDDRMVKMSNLPSPHQEEESSRVIQRGPLTFDPSSPTRKAEDVQLAAANNQAKYAMALPFWPPELPQAQAAPPQWQDSKEACQGAASQVRRLLFWRNDEASLARQGNKGRPQGLCCDQTWTVHLG
jgi:hypothetical protein